jgi:hypothetical protein
MTTVIMCGVATVRVGAALGIERRFDLDHERAETSCHCFDHVVAADAKPFAGNLCRQVAVSQMPGNANEMLRIAATNFSQRLRRCDYLDETAVFQHQRVAAAQRDRAFEVEQELKSARAGHCHPAPMTIIEAENDGVSRGLFPVVPALNVGRTDHAEYSLPHAEEVRRTVSKHEFEAHPSRRPQRGLLRMRL